MRKLLPIVYCNADCPRQVPVCSGDGISCIFLYLDQALVAALLYPEHRQRMESQKFDRNMELSSVTQMDPVIVSLAP